MTAPQHAQTSSAQAQAPGWWSGLLDLADAHADWLIGLGLLSAVTAVLGVALVPRWLAGLHRDHFVEPSGPRHDRNGLRRWLPWMLRNLLGLVLLVAGVLMLVLPGQGLLTCLVALGLVDFPGKRRLRLRLICHPPLRRALQRLRHARGRPPFRLPGFIGPPKPTGR